MTEQPMALVGGDLPVGSSRSSAKNTANALTRICRRMGRRPPHRGGRRLAAAALAE